MLVRCLKNKIAQIEDSVMQMHVKECVHLEEIGLTIGECYRVFGVFFRNGIPWYLLCEESQDEYPKPSCSVFFELVDASVEPGWSLSLNNSNVGGVSILPDRWANDGSFLERLVDGEPDSVSYFNELKRKGSLLKESDR